MMIHNHKIQHLKRIDQIVFPSYRELLLIYFYQHKSDYNFYISVNPHKKSVLKKKINQEISKINISNLINLNDDSQYESTVEEVQTTRLFSEYSFCKNIHPDDIDIMFDKL